MSEHTDAARLEATRDAIRTGTAPRPRVEGEAWAPRMPSSVVQDEINYCTHKLDRTFRDEVDLRAYLYICQDWRDFQSRLARLTAEVERLKGLAQLGEKVIAVALVKERFKVAGAELFKQTSVPGQYSDASDAYAKAQQELREAVEAAITCPDCGGSGRFTSGGIGDGYADPATGEWCGPEYCGRCDGTGKAAALALPTPAPEATNDGK